MKLYFTHYCHAHSNYNQNESLSVMFANSKAIKFQFRQYYSLKIRECIITIDTNEAYTYLYIVMGKQARNVRAHN